MNNERINTYEKVKNMLNYKSAPMELSRMTAENYENVQLTTSNKSVAYAVCLSSQKQAIIYSCNKGTATIGVTVDGKSLGNITVVVKQPKMNEKNKYGSTTIKVYINDQLYWKWNDSWSGGK